MGKWIQITRSKYRTVVSDILPYEKPIFFTNQYFARFLTYYGVCIIGGQMVATKHNTPELELFLHLISGASCGKRKPFVYNISKDNSRDARQLTLLHPYQQLQMVEFYERYKMLLIEFCSKSHFSLRYPYKVATYKRKAKDILPVLSDENPKEESNSFNLKHYFAYKRYNNINNFYDDYLYLRAEKQFKNLYKLDLHKCFENINAFDLGKAIYGENIPVDSNDMATQFAQLQKSFLTNDKQNGIVIGPEFSRIFAEMILQSIDVETERILEENDIRYSEHYVFYRYVDDGFLFFNDENVKTQFRAVYSETLEKYGQSINDEKTKDYSCKPFVNQITRVKFNIKSLITSSFENKLENFLGFIHLQEGRFDAVVDIKYKNFIQEFRNIVGVGGEVTYKDIMSYTLGLIKKQLHRRLKDFNDIYKPYKYSNDIKELQPKGQKILDYYEKEFLIVASELIEILFFLLNCDSRMNTSVHIVALINRIQMFVRGLYVFDDGSRSCKFRQKAIWRLDEVISDEIAKILETCPPYDCNLMEILNILELEKLMNPSCRISPSRLSKFVSQTNEKDLNFFVVFEILHLIQNKTEFEGIMERMMIWINTKIQQLQTSNDSCAENVLVLIETLACPWIQLEQKRKICDDLFGNENEEAMIHFLRKQGDMFINWRNYNIESTMKLIDNTEVY